jgi:hypothetical protein
MKKEPLSLEHQHHLRESLQQMHMCLSEYSFADAYLFRNVHRFEVWHGQALYLKGMTRDDVSYLMPLQPWHTLPVAEIMHLLTYEVECLFPLSEKGSLLFPATEFLLTTEAADSDYVYTVQKMRLYPGRHLSAKRNLVRQFLANYTATSYPLSKEHLAAALTVLEHWQAERGDIEGSDYNSCLEALEMWGKLAGLDGRIYYVEGVPAGIIIGETLNPRMYVMRFVKALKAYKGIYQYMYQVLAQHLDDYFYFLNLEQDLGKPSLRQAKNSYQPDYLYSKWRVSLQPAVKAKIQAGELPASSYPKILDAGITQEEFIC